MSRRILIQVTAPAVLIGLILLGASLASVSSINRLQRNLAGILSENVASLEAAQELEIKLRQLRFHSFMCVLDPTPARRSMVEEDHRGFESALEQARRSTSPPDGRRLVEQVAAEYAQYRADLASAATPQPNAGREAFVAWSDAHHIGEIQVPCQELLRVNKAEMERTARESGEVSSRVRTAMLVLGLAGPVGGLIAGFGIARGLSRSIAQLLVRVQDVHAQLDRDVASVRLTEEGGLGRLDAQLAVILERVRDVVGQLQRQERDVLRAEQLAAVGQLAAGVAHEVRNPLASIKLLVGAALAGRPPRPLEGEDLRVIHAEVERLERKVQNLLDYARPARPERGRCDLGPLIARAIDLVHTRARQQNVRVDTDLPDQPAEVEVDADQFTGVLVNLFLNALDAMPHGGTLCVALTPAGPDWVALKVADTGRGIDPSVADRLFTPFASTKPTGTGLGLSVCRRVVAEHGGTLSGANRPEGGACFTVTLPAPSREGSHADAADR
jgi:signal transduction histidine kinase